MEIKLAYTVKDLAPIIGVNARTIQVYTDRGIVLPEFGTMNRYQLAARGVMKYSEWKKITKFKQGKNMIYLNATELSKLFSLHTIKIFLQSPDLDGYDFHYRVSFLQEVQEKIDLIYLSAMKRQETASQDAPGSEITKEHVG